MKYNNYLEDQGNLKIVSWNKKLKHTEVYFTPNDLSHQFPSTTTYLEIGGK